MMLKDYQDKALDWLEKFLRRCKESHNPRFAYEETTREWRGMGLHYHPLPTLPQVPYVCLRIPTGGGKTLIGGLAIDRANHSLLFTEHSVTLWLVPSEPIREQTLKALRAPTNLLHQSVFSALGEVTVMDIDDALRIKPNVLSGSNVIIVSTMQAFKQEETDRLSVYKQNSEMLPHFEDVSDVAVIGSRSLVDVLRMHHPFVIVDEAHNQGTPLAVDTLARLEPSAILELTATPDRSYQPSNVLFSVSAAELQVAEMIKMPLDLVRRENWQDALRDAIGCLGMLQEKANSERDYLRPIMLVQAERRDPDRETLIPERVKEALINDFGIPVQEVAIATGVTDEIAGEDILSEKSRRRFIITIDKLREGWDCPFAYVLCSFRNTNSSIAAEQILGRILRMPGAKRKAQRELNESYAFVTSSDFQATVESLRDGLVKNGFERQETKDLIVAQEGSLAGDLFMQDSTVTFTAPELPEPEMIPAVLEGKVEIVPEQGSITLKGTITSKQALMLESIFETIAGKQAIHQAITELRNPRAKRQRAPSEEGELFRVPLLAVKQGDLWEPFEETHLLQSDWRLLDYPCELKEGEFKNPEKVVQGGRFVVREERIKFEYFDNIEAHLAMFDFQSDWDQVKLLSWLERNIPEQSIVPDQKAAFLNKAVNYLLEQRVFTLEELIYSKFRLRAALEEKVRDAKRQAMQSIHRSLIAVPERFSSARDLHLVFRQGRYAYDWIYSGFVALPKHFFPQIGNLRAIGEEFECALFIATQLEGVRYWVRNVERKSTSFSLQTSTDRFYPDFVCCLEDDRILIVEYKNERDWELEENEEKRQLGALWESRSSGKALFIMPRGMDWESIREKVRR
jgi:type III restriction enzyme